jgi:hypothetical protein
MLIVTIGFLAAGTLAAYLLPTRPCRSGQHRRRHLRHHRHPWG